MSVLLRSRLRKKKINEHAIRSLAQKVLVLAGASEVELSLELVGNTRMRSLNKQYRDQDRTTDVLAFPQWEGPGPRTSMLGDVVISVPKAESQAAALGHTVDEEMVHLLTHGILHLLGYDHERSEREAQRMRRKEHVIMKSLRPFPKIIRERMKK